MKTFYNILVGFLVLGCLASSAYRVYKFYQVYEDKHEKIYR